jgi:CHAT domain-containing protein/Tfp pilus assembly protein PilF
MRRYFLICLQLVLLQFSSLCLSQSINTINNPDTLLANKTFDKAKDLYSRAKYDSSKYYLEQASLIYEKAAIQYNEPKMWEKYVSCINNIGNNFRRQGNYDKAMEHLDKALEIALDKFGEENRETANIYNDIGTVYYFKGDFEKTSTFYNKALKIRIKIHGENHLKVASSYNNVAIIYAQRNENDKAIEHYNKSLNIIRELIGEKHSNVADTYHNIGLVYVSKGDYNEALKWYHKSLAIRLEVLGDYHPRVALSYNSIGVCYYEKGDLDQAFEYYTKSTAIYNRTVGANHPRMADNYNNLGIVYYKKGDYSQALEYYNKSLSIKKNVLDEFHPSIANTFNNIGNIYLDKGDYDKALESYNQCLAIRQKSLTENDSYFVYNYYNIGRAYYEKNNLNKALENYTKSLNLGLKVLGENDIKVAENYNNIGVVYSKKGDFKQALAYHQKSLQILQLNENYIKTAETFQSIGNLYFEQNDFEQALSFNQKAIVSLVPDFDPSNIYSNPSFENIRSENLLLVILEFKADVLSKLYSAKSHEIKDIEMSLNTYQHATELINKIRGSYKAEGSKLFLGMKTSKLFDKAIGTALKLFELTQNIEYKQMAFMLAEKGKSSVLMASLQDSKARQFSNIPDSLLKQEKEMKIDLAYYDTQILKEVGKNEDQDSVKIKNFESKRFSLNRQYQDLVEKMETSFPEYYNLKYQSQTVAIPALQKCLDNNSMILEYFIANRLIHIFVISNNLFDVISVPVDSAFYTLAESMNKSIKKVDISNFVQTSYKVYSYLFDPVEKFIATKEKLIIIPHSVLYKIPFEALLSQQTKEINITQLDYLIKKFDVSYQYSSTLYMNSLEKEKKLFAKENKKENMFVGFAPVFSEKKNNGYILTSNLPKIEHTYADVGLRAISLDGKRFNELSFSEKEVREIIKQYESTRQRAAGYFFDNASEDNFKKNVGNYRHVHIATHGIINEENPQLSGLIFSQPADSTFSEDGILYSSETYNLDLDAALVVLSSCESGIGIEIRGEGLMALTRGFLYSGAANLVVSLWKVSDKHTSELMVEFYKNILENKSYSHSLRAAKLKMIGNAKTAFPRSWSSFVLLGN